MKILQVTPYFATAWAYGGPPRVMHDYAAGLVARGHAVDVFTTDVLDEDTRAARDDRRRSRTAFSQCEQRPRLACEAYLPRGLLASLVRAAGHYDALHTTDTRTFVAASAHVTSSIRKVPLVVSAFGRHSLARMGCAGR